MNKHQDPININELVDPTHTVCADFNQGNESVFGSNAGKQCFAMSINAILYNEMKSVVIWDRPIMNVILVNENNLIVIISMPVKKDFLPLTETSERVSIVEHTYYSESFSGS